MNEWTWGYWLQFRLWCIECLVLRGWREAAKLFCIYKPRLSVAGRFLEAGLECQSDKVKTPVSHYAPSLNAFLYSNEKQILLEHLHLKLQGDDKNRHTMNTAHPIPHFCLVPCADVQFCFYLTMFSLFFTFLGCVGFLPGIILSLLNINKSNERLQMASYVFVWEQKLKLGSGLQMRLWGKARWMRVLMLVPLSSSPRRRGLDSRWGLRCHILAVIPLQSMFTCVHEICGETRNGNHLGERQMAWGNFPTHVALVILIDHSVFFL